jgi:flavin-dependent dehydrogenase
MSDQVAIVGSGPAGCAAAIALCRAGATVALIGDGADGVGEQLHPAARPLLERLGLGCLTGQLDCVGVRSAWRTPELHAQDFVGHPFGSGWLLDRASFGTTLRRAAVRAGASLREPSRLLGLVQADGPRASVPRWELVLSDGELSCDFVIDATGRRGTVARLLGVARRRFDRQVARVGFLAAAGEQAAADADATLTVETTDDGWWYSCRLPGRRRVAGLIGTRRVPAECWEARLRATRHLAPLVAGYRLVGAPVVRAAGSSLLARCFGPGWIAIGDAAASHDPLASRGLAGALAGGLDAAALVGAPEERLRSWQQSLEAGFARYLRERAQLVPGQQTARRPRD